MRRTKIPTTNPSTLVSAAPLSTCSNAKHPSSPTSTTAFAFPTKRLIRFEDNNLGPQSFKAGTDFGDFLVWRKDGLPQLSTRLRSRRCRHATSPKLSADATSSSPPPARSSSSSALMLPTPTYFHTHLLTNKRGIRLAKRHDALAIRTLRQQGLTPTEVLHMTTVTFNS